MRKIWIIIFAILIFAVGISAGIIVDANIRGQSQAISENKIEKVSQTVTDECVEEWNNIQKTENEISVSSNEEKISPNCKLTLKRHYTECDHTINEYLDIPVNLVNKTQKDLEKEYPNWEVEKYSNTEIVLFREFNSNCGQHYILKDVDGKIVVYLMKENNEEEIYEETDISVEYLTETDKIEIANGIKVYGQENLNQLIEDFE